MPQKVLLIDDSRTMRQVLKVYLMGGKYDFLEAESGSRALDVMRLAQVDLVIADINMPRMDGIAFVEAVRASDLPQVSRVPIILVTSDKSEELRVRVKDARPDAFLQKPLDAEKLLEAVERLLMRSQRPPSSLAPPSTKPPSTKPPT